MNIYHQVRNLLLDSYEYSMGVSSLSEKIIKSRWKEIENGLAKIEPYINKSTVLKKSVSRK